MVQSYTTSVLHLGSDIKTYTVQKRKNWGRSIRPGGKERRKEEEKKILMYSDKSLTVDLSHKFSTGNFC